MITNEIRTVKVVDSQELFSSLPASLVNELWDACPFSFGDCNLSLVDAYSVRNWITDIFDDEENEQVNNVLATLKSLAAERVYIDLEN
jgi:hypothetical protein